MSHQTLLAEVRNLIAQDKMPAAMKIMRSLLENTPTLNDILQQSGRLANVQRQLNLGNISQESATLEQNRIRYGVLELLSEIEKQGLPPAPLGELLAAVEQESTRPELRGELERAISIINSKNVVAGSTVSAGGNIHIGDIYTTPAPPPMPKPQDFNKKLTQKLVEAMRPHHENAEKLCQDFSWLENAENLRKVQQFVFRNFVGEIGKQLRNLVNIGADEQMEAAKKQQHYVKKCSDIAKRTLDLVNFTLLSSWWENIKTAPRPLENGQRKVLSDFFEKNLEHPLEQQFNVLRTFAELFARHKMTLPFAELNDWQTKLAENGTLHLACRHLEATVNAGNCEKSEELLAEIMGHFAFLTRYRMASIKKIGYRQIRNGKPEYLHRYVALGIDVKYSEDAEKGNWIAIGEQTPSVMLYRGEDYSQGINLFPFVIDFNALTFEQGAKICFFSTKDLANERVLEFRFLGDNSIERIEKQGIFKPETNLSELMMDEEKLKTLNLDCVVDAFLDAKNDILSPGGDFFDKL